MLLRLPENIRRYRAAITLSVIVSVLLVVVQTATFSRDQAMASLATKARSDLSRYHLSLQQKLDQYRDLPALLSTHSTVVNALSSFGAADTIQRANQYLAHANSTMGAADIYLMNLEGTTIAASNWQQTHSFVGRNYSFRPYFQTALRGRAGLYFALGTASKQRGFYFSYPVYAQETVIGVAVVKINLNDIEESWSDPNQYILVTDEDGVIFISTRSDLKFKTLTQLSDDDLKRIVASLRYGGQALSSLDVTDIKKGANGERVVVLAKDIVASAEADSGGNSREYLMHDMLLQAEGLQIIVLTNTATVRKQMLTTVVMTAVICITFVLLGLFLFERRRIKRERERFKRQRTRALEENEERIRAIIDNTRAGLITLDALGRIISFNITAERLFGYRHNEVKGNYFSMLLSQDDRPLCWSHITANDSDTKSELFIEARGRRTDGQYFPIELIISQAYVVGVKRFIVTIHDIRQRKEYEQQLQRARDELESRVEARTQDLTQANAKLQSEMFEHTRTRNELIQTAKLAVLGQVSAGINHELNQPLAAIRAYSENAIAFLKLERTDIAVTNLSHIVGLTERMTKIIHPLKEFARKSEDQPANLCLKTVFDGVMSVMYSRVLKERAKVNLPDNLENVYVKADLLRIEQVLINLMTNGLQAMERQDTRVIDVAVEPQADRVLIHLRDHGKGIPAANLPQIFEPFFTTKKVGQGLGLGLSISHRIIDNLNGRLSAVNHPEGGACFTVELPIGTLPTK